MLVSSPDIHGLLCLDICLCHWIDCLHIYLHNIVFFHVDLLRRILHLVAQKIELAFSEGKVEMSSLPHTIARGDENSFFVRAEVQLDASLSRTQAASLVRAELIRRFLCKASGFVGGARHSENQDLVNSTKNNSIGLGAATQYVTAYMTVAQRALLDKLSLQKFSHISYYHDAAKICTFEALGHYSLLKTFGTLKFKLIVMFGLQQSMCMRCLFSVHL